MTTNILIQKDSATLIPKAVTGAEREAWARDFTIYDVRADGSKGPAYGPTRTTEDTGAVTASAAGGLKKGPDGEDILTADQVAAVVEDLETRGLAPSATWPTPLERTDGQFADLPYPAQCRFQVDPRTSAWKEVITGRSPTYTGTHVYAAHPSFSSRKVTVCDGTTDKYLTVPNAQMGSINGPFAIWWLVVPSLTRAAATAEARYVMQWLDAAVRGIALQLTFHSIVANQCIAQVSWGAASSFVTVNSQTDLLNGVPYLVTFVSDGLSGGNNRLYINQVCEAQGSNTNFPITPVNGDALIGVRNTHVGTTAMKGNICEFGIIRKYLTASDVSNLYEAVLGTSVRRFMFLDDLDTDVDGVNSLGLAGSGTLAGWWDMTDVVIDGVDIHASPAAQTMVNAMKLDFVPVYQTTKVMGDMSVSYTTAPNDWPGTVTTAFRTPSNEDRTATGNAAGTINTANVNYPNYLAGMKAGLAASPDGCMTICMSGFANTMLDLLQDPAGLALFTAKVDTLYIVAGWWYDTNTDGTSEYNANRDQTNWRTLFRLLPPSVRVRIVPVELGYTVAYAPYAGKSVSTNPMAKAVATAYGSAATERNMWGDMGIIAALAGEAAFDVAPTRGRIVWQVAASPSGGIGGHTTIDPTQTDYDHSYLVFNPAKVTPAALKTWALAKHAAWMP